MTNMNTAPSQPVNDEQGATAANDPITIAAEGPFGTISWTPDEHTQERLRELDKEGRLEGYLKFAWGQLSNTGTMISMGLCFDKNPILSLIATLLGADGPGTPPYGTMPKSDLDGETLEDYLGRNFPRS